MPSGSTYYPMNKLFRIYKDNIMDKNKYFQEGKKGDYLLVPLGADFGVVTPEAFNLRWPPIKSVASRKMEQKMQPTATSKDLLNPTFITNIVRKNR